MGFYRLVCMGTVGDSRLTVQYLQEIEGVSRSAGTGQLFRTVE
jgi:hypothetical protein